MQLTKLSEDLKLVTGRCNTATAQYADLHVQLAAVCAENASLQTQLADCEACKAEAAAANEQQQGSLQAVQSDLHR